MRAALRAVRGVGPVVLAVVAGASSGGRSTCCHTDGVCCGG